jgi:hypothetical protein
MPDNDNPNTSLTSGHDLFVGRDTVGRDKM